MPKYPENTIRRTSIRIIQSQLLTGVRVIALIKYTRAKIRKAAAIFPFLFPGKKGRKKTARNTAYRQICTADNIL
jgi:hypothetical protein